MQVCRRMRCRSWLLICLAWSMIGCAARPMADPALVMVDRQQSPARRMAAARQLQESNATADALLSASRVVLWSHGYSQPERELALMRLLADDEAATRQKLADEPQFLPSVDILRTVYEIAVERNWQEFIATAVRMYAQPLRGIPDNARPERDVLTSLSGGKAPEAVFAEVFVDRDANYSDSDHVAAWVAMMRLMSRDDVIAVLESAPSNVSVLVADLQAGWRDLGVLPPTREQVLWLMEARRPPASVWASFNSVARRLPDIRTQALQLRHYAALHDSAGTKGATWTTRAQLEASLLSQLSSNEVYRRNPGYPTSDMDPPQTFVELRDAMAWGDMVVVQQLLFALREPSVIASLFEQADADHADTTTEHAGVLLRDPEGKLVARAMPPLVARHDFKHYASPDLIYATYRGLAHYHFHAQQYDNRQYAGPGRGDMVFSENMGFNCVVLTFISRDKLNVDFYADGKLIVDLGVIHRPAGR